MFLNVLKKTDYETKLLLRCGLDVTARKDYEFGWKLKLPFFGKVTQNLGFSSHNQPEILACFCKFINLTFKINFLK